MAHAAFEKLYERLSGTVLAYAMSVVGQEAAQEVAAETFATAWEKFEKCPAEPKLQLHWVLRITSFKIKHFTDARRRKHHDNRYAHDYPEPVSLDTAPDTAIERDLARFVISNLTADQLELMALSNIAGMSNDGIAQVLDVSSGALRVRVSRLNSHIRSLAALYDSEMKAGSHD